MTGYLERDLALEYLREHPEGVTPRQVAERYGVSFTAAQNILRQLYMDGEADVTVPRRINESKRFVLTGGGR